MNTFVKYVVFFAALALGNLIYKLNQTEPVESLPETWWGKTPRGEEDESVRPFVIHVPDQVLEDLKTRLKNARTLTPPLQGIQQQYGMNTKLLQEIVDFWANKYDWRASETFLNQYPQYKTKIQGLDIHFIRAKADKIPPGVKVLPLLLLHGWPGSVREFYEMIPMLTTPQKGKNFVFEVVVPSLPGYGFSEAPALPGMGTRQVAVIFKNLMIRLGFPQFYAQGGDWGSAISSDLAIQFPEHVKGIHLNMCVSNAPIATLKVLLGSLWPRLIVSEKNEHKMYPLSNMFANTILEFGYMHLQATKPDTIGVALNDSPIGLAAYILEKFTTWTNPEWKNRADGGLKDKYTYTKLLDNVMIYWVTNSITTSMRLYSESLNKEQNVFTYHNPVPVPTACAVFDNEIIYQSETVFKHKYPNLVHNGEHSGGHFAALEVPETLSKDIWTAVSKFEQKK